MSGNPVVGADFDVIAELSLASDVTEGSVNLSGSLNGLNFLNVDQDLCTATDIALPLNAGDMYVQSFSLQRPRPLHQPPPYPV